MQFARIFFALLAALSIISSTGADNPRQTNTARPGEKRISGREPADSVEVKHSPKQVSGWSVAETANFRILHAQSPKLAEKVARIAEKTRLAMMRKWFDKDTAPWSPKCDIYLHPTTKSYTWKTGAPASSPGHTTFQVESGRVLSRRVDLRCNESHMLTSVLPHETTHAVLAGKFGRRLVPRWADEGMAVLSEPRERINLHLRDLPKHKRDNTLFKVGKLMRMKEYPEPRLIGAFYAQSVSLVDFLNRKKGASTFARFLRDGLDRDYESALKRHYGYGSLAELERAWRQYAFGEGSVAAR